MKIELLPFSFAGPVQSWCSLLVTELEKVNQSGLVLDKLEMNVNVSNPNIFDFKIVASGGRQWIETITKDTSNVLWHSFNVNDAWLRAEYTSFRVIRDLMETFVLLGITKLKVDF